MVYTEFLRSSNLLFLFVFYFESMVVEYGTVVRHVSHAYWRELLVPLFERLTVEFLVCIAVREESGTVFECFSDLPCFFSVTGSGGSTIADLSGASEASSASDPSSSLSSILSKLPESSSLSLADERTRMGVCVGTEDELSSLPSLGFAKERCMVDVEDVEETDLTAVGEETGEEWIEVEGEDADSESEDDDGEDEGEDEEEDEEELS